MDDKLFLLPLSFGLGTIITSKHVSLAYKEAYSYPDGSKGRIAFLAYAHRLEKECDKNEGLDAK